MSERSPSPSLASIEVTPLDPTKVEAWQALFDASHSPCFCRYWHFEGPSRAWVQRCGLEPDENRREQTAAIEAGETSAQGLLAWLDGTVVGWMKLAPRASLPKLRNLPVYRSLDLGPDTPGTPLTFVVGCLLVHPAFRHRGVARALIEAAPAYVVARGASVLEAFPRHTDEPTHDEELLMGPERLFVEAGFTQVGGCGQYPVYRRVVRIT